MRVDYHPEPHVCRLPPAEDYRVGTTIICEGIRGYQFDVEAQAMKPVLCNARYRRSETWWRKTPVWVPPEPGW
jgi:hypothetical protein